MWDWWPWRCKKVRKGEAEAMLEHVQSRESEINVLGERLRSVREDNFSPLVQRAMQRHRHGET